MNENIDLTKILKDCPKGWKFYSPLFGKIEFHSINDSTYPIRLSLSNEGFAKFSKEGFYFSQYYIDVECLLFPSKDQRDWSKFTAPWYKKDKFDPKTLKPFDRVLLRNYCNEEWSCDTFSHIKQEDTYPYVCIGSVCKCCIPYNDDTKHLVGKNKEAPEFYRYWED